jgi:cleavage and polyadenylation specificity factor subunit 1
LPHDLRSQLILIKGTLLEIYNVGPDGNLTILLEKTLYGVAESLAVLKGDREASSVDALMITFRDAKLSVMQWDVASHDLVCSSLHYYEGNKYSKAGWEVFARGPLAVADPQGRCGAVLFYRHLLAVLPTMESEAQLYGFTEDTSNTNQKLNNNNNNNNNNNGSAANFANGYVDNLASTGIKEVRDAVFLHGYNEPVLLVLHEVEATWTGIYSEKKDTCALTALSLNLSAKRHPKIWGATKLPSDAYAMVSCPSSGGALVLCQSMVLYYEQGQQAGIVLSQAALPSGGGAPPPPLEFDMSQPPEKVAGEYANKHVRDIHPTAVSECIKFCDKSMAESNLECDAARATWLNDNTALLCLKHGQLLLLVLEKRGGSVTIKVAKAGSAPPPSAACTLASDLIFLGSLAGDSLVVKLSLAVHGLNTDDGDAKQQLPPSKRQKTDTNDDEEDDSMDEEEMFVYGMEDDDAGYSAMPSYKMIVADTLLNHGPINDIIIGKHDDSDPSSSSKYILTCSGRGKQGSLIQMNQSVIPDIITSVPLPGVSDIFAVHASSSNPLHSYLLMSFSSTNTTKVLATGDELQEVTDSMTTFASDTATLYAATLNDTTNDGVFIIQAYSQGMRLVSPPPAAAAAAGDDASSTLKQEIIAEKELGSKIAHVDAMDAYVLVLLETKVAVLLQLVNGTLSEIIRISNRSVEACCLYRDTAGWVSPQESILMIVADGHDTLEMYALPKKESVWRCHCAAQGYGVLHHSDTTIGDNSSGGVFIVDVNMTSFPAPSDMRSDLGKPMTVAPCSLPVVVALTNDGRLLAYRATSSSSSAMMSRIYLSNMPPRISKNSVSKRRRIASFHALGEHIPFSGFFIAGDTPYWLIAHRGRLLAHPHHHHHQHHQGGGFTSGFTPFHNVNCPWGFITAESQQEISIAQFPSKTRLDAPLPRMKIAMKATPLRITYYPEAHLYALLMSKQVAYIPYLPEEEGGEVQASYSYALADAAAKASGIMQQGEVRLVQPGSWNTVWQYALLPGEKALSIAAVHLKDTTTSETIPFIAVGAGFLAGEDYPCSGRLILFKVRKNTNTTTTTTTTTKQGWTGEVAYSREFKGPVTSIAEVDGSLVISTGNRIETCIISSSRVTVDDVTIDDGDDDDVGKAAGDDDIKVAYRLIRSAFHDGPILITSMQAIKSYILAGDVHHSVQFIQCTNEGKQLQYLGKDFSKVEVDAVQFLISKSTLSLVVADKSGTLRMLVYDRRNPESWGGDRLLPCGLFHIGDTVECMTRVQLAQISKDDTTVRQAVVYGTSNGCIGMLAPLAVSGEGGEVGEKLVLVQKALNRGLVHTGGLNPAAFRRRFGKIPAGAGGIVEWGKPVPLHGVLDGELLGRMEELTVEEQEELEKGGVDVDGVVGAMIEMNKASVLF